MQTSLSYRSESTNCTSKLANDTSRRLLQSRHKTKMADTGSRPVPDRNTSRKAIKTGVLNSDDPKCDLVLEVTGQEGAIDLCVSSKALSLASSVFDKMLSSRFKEGISQIEGSGRKRIPLPEDDGDALLSICLVVHHRLSELAEALSPRVVLEIASVSEKYDFTDTLRHWSTVWILGSKSYI